MRVHVVIATRGRAAEVGVLVGYLAQQTLRSASTTIVGVDERDIAGLAETSKKHGYASEIVLSPRAGLPIQRNHGISILREHCVLGPDAAPGIVVFFDDDFRPEPTWLENARAVLSEREDITGLTGKVLADGVKGKGLSEEEARRYLSGEIAPMAHWASGDEERDCRSVYGCNMAFRSKVFETCAFDERLPLYAWQEDRDFTHQALRLGRVIYTPRCRGVHLGAKRARTDGTKLGYSQIANPLYLSHKGTMGRSIMMRFVMRAIAANHHGAMFRRCDPADYPGRLKGNYVALFDVLKRNCRPEKILEL